MGFVTPFTCKCVCLIKPMPLQVSADADPQVHGVVLPMPPASGTKVALQANLCDKSGEIRKCCLMSYFWNSSRI